MKKIFVFAMLLSSCKITKTTSHPLLREDGFYYRRLSNDLFQLIKFYRNGRLALIDIYCKHEYFYQDPNRLACIIDTTSPKQFRSLAMINFSLKKDSIHFKNKAGDYKTQFNVLFLCKLNTDSLTVKLNAIDIKGEKEQIKNTGKCVSLQFVKASCDLSLLPPAIRPDYELDKAERVQVR